MRRTPARDEVFPRQGVAAAHVMAGLRQLIAENLGEEAAAAIVARHDDRPLRQLGDVLVHDLGRHAAQAEVDRAGDVRRREIGRIADIDEDRLFLLDHRLHLFGVEQGVAVGIVGNRPQLGQVAGAHAGHVAAFDDPLLQAADHELGVDAHFRHRLGGFRAAIAVVAEQNDRLVGEVEIGLLQIGKANDRRALQRTHRLLRVFADIQENVFVGFATIVGREQLGGLLRADPQRMLALLREVDFLGIRIVRKARRRAGRPQQRVLQARLALVGLLDILPDVDADRDGQHGEQADRRIKQAARHFRRAAALARPHGGVSRTAAEDGGRQREQLRDADERSDHQFRRRNGEGLPGSEQTERKRPERGHDGESGSTGNAPDATRGTHLLIPRVGVADKPGEARREPSGGPAEKPQVKQREMCRISR